MRGERFVPVERILVQNPRIPEFWRDPQGSLPTAGGRHMLRIRALDSSPGRMFQRPNMGFPPLEHEFSMDMCDRPFDIPAQGVWEGCGKRVFSQEHPQGRTSTIPWAPCWSKIQQKSHPRLPLPSWPWFLHIPGPALMARAVFCCLFFRAPQTKRDG